MHFEVLLTQQTPKRSLLAFSKLKFMAALITSALSGGSYFLTGFNLGLRFVYTNNMRTKSNLTNLFNLSVFN